MVGLGLRAGVNTRALVTAMDVPLGRTAGNAVEVTESVEVLAGGGPCDIVELTVTLAREMLDAVGIDADPEAALADGRAMDAWRTLIRAQGGDPDAPLPQPRHTHTVTAARSGVVTKLDAMAIGRAVWLLGAGRSRKEDPVAAAAGATWHAVPGDEVTVGAPLITLQCDDERLLGPALAEVEAGMQVGDPGTVVDRLPLILDRIVS
jgi:thymidine phosphorylase